MKLKDFYKMLAQHRSIKGSELKNMVNTFDEDDLIEFEKESFVISIDSFANLIGSSNKEEDINEMAEGYDL